MRLRDQKNPKCSEDDMTIKMLLVVAIVKWNKRVLERLVRAGKGSIAAKREDGVIFYMVG